MMVKFLAIADTIRRQSLSRHLLHRLTTLATLVTVVLVTQVLYAPILNAQSNDSPNIVLIMTDDQGYQDVGCYGSPLIKTPHLDRMAAEGMRFTSFYSASSICSPSRAGLLTGCYPPRVGIPSVLFPSNEKGLNPSEITIAELLKQKGYATACIGKWHLGHKRPFLPTRQGFDYYYGIPYSNDMWIDPEAPLAEDIELRQGVTVDQIRNGESKRNWVPLMRNEEVIEYPANQSTLTQRYTEQALDFISDNHDQPFFLYLPHTMPHIPLAASEEFRGRSERGLYGDIIEELDASTGKILQALKDHGIDENTLVIYTSDNGPWKLDRERGGSADPLRGFKFSTYEGGMRVPCIMRWPGTIPKGVDSSKMAATIDLLPTLAELCGIPAPADRALDGTSLAGLLKNPGAGTTPRDTYCYYKGNNLQAFRSGPWKLRRTKEAVQLFNLEKDIAESQNLADQHPERVAELTRQMEKFDERLKSNTRPAGTLSNLEPLDGSRREVYKTVDGVELAVHIFEPAGHQANDARAVAVFFFGGGWQSGNVKQFAPHCRYLASRGMVAMVADYRVANRHGTTPFECVKDGKSVIRWIRQNADRLGVDPDRIAAGGGSAGGHVAAATATAREINEAGEDTTVSARPNALLLFNPVYDNGPDGYGYNRLGERYRDISPMHNIYEGMPPAIVFLGTNDRLIPVDTAKRFQQKMREVGSRSELHLYEGQPHGFFNHPSFRKGASPEFYNETVYQMDQFLTSLGFLDGEPTIKAAEFQLNSESDRSLAISYGGRKLARYMFNFDPSNQETLHETYKPYLHVYDNRGENYITKGPGGLYTHHRGIFIGFSQLGSGGNKYDLWSMRDGVQVHQSFSEQSAGDESATVTSLVHWQDDQGNLLLTEHRTFTFLPPPKNAYALIEMTSVLEATRGALQLAGDPEHAGVQFRPANDIVKSKTEYHFHEAGINPRSDRDMPWVGETFRLPEGQYSVVMLNHPDNPKGTVFSAYRDYGRFGAYPVFDLDHGQPKKLTYRWIISAGEMPSQEIIGKARRAFIGE